MNNITIARTPINILFGENFEEVRVVEDGSAIAFVDHCGDSNFVFEAQNAVIVEVRNGGRLITPCDAAELETGPAEAFPFFDVASVSETTHPLIYIGGKLVTFKVFSAGEVDASEGDFPPIEIVLYARDHDAEVSLVQAFRADEEDLLAKCSPVKSMTVKLPTEFGSEKLDMGGLIEKDATFAEALEDDDNQPPIGDGMSLAEALAAGGETMDDWLEDDNHLMTAMDDLVESHMPPSSSPVVLKEEWRVTE